MSSEWAAEHVVDAPRAAALIAAQIPALAGAPVVPLATGWDNTVHLVDGVWAFRFPRRAIAVPLLHRERAVLPVLARALPLAIPVPEHIGAPDGDYPWPFWGGRLVPGVELADSDLDEEARGPAAAAVGELLAALHAPALLDRVGAHLPVDPTRRAEPQVRIPRAREFLVRLEERGAALRLDDVDSLFAEASSLGPPQGAGVVSHGDLHIRHLLVDERGRATGVIDWGDVCVADPSVDLSLAYSGFSGAPRAALLSAYPRLTAEQELRARVLAVMLCAALADYASSDDRPALLAEALRGLRRAVTD